MDNSFGYIYKEFNLDIKYYTFPDDPGMIYYGYVKRTEPEEVVETEKEIEYQQVAIAAAEGAGVVAGGYILYRLIRMLPSLAPPLWWTIPANAVCP